MKTMWQGGLVVVLAAVFAVALLGTHPTALGRAADEGKTAGPRYTVIETQGFNLLVTDNANNKLYYYATDKDVPVGSPLKLRASLDLTTVGKPELKITPHNLEHMRTKEGAKESSRE